MTDNTARRPRWRPFVCFAVFLALAALLLVPAFQRQPSAGVRARFDQIEHGMTERQVGEMLGGPRGNYGQVPHPLTTAVGLPGSNSRHRSWWYFPDCTVEVDFDDDHRVAAKRIEPLPRQSLSRWAVRWYRQTFPEEPGP